LAAETPANQKHSNAMHLNIVNDDNLPAGLMVFIFHPSCPPVFLEDQRKIKTNEFLCDLCVSAVRKKRESK
jgi:hypothetical protein